MAQTFTGLKLQGEIGKFGQLELSDVTGVAELPDGKVVCGSEYGTLILWDGNLVKAHLVLDAQKKTPLHNGFIEVVMFNGEHFITAGGDGFIKWWRFSDVDNAEADETLEVAISPVKEQLVKDPKTGEPAYIVSMIKGRDHWLIADGKGKIWKLMHDETEPREITSFHSKQVRDLAIP
jgi:WD40 repeat protein